MGSPDLLLEDSDFEDAVVHSSWQLKPRDKGQVLIIVNLWRITGAQYRNTLEAAVCYYSINIIPSINL